jgi:hypothetical protein
MGRSRSLDTETSRASWRRTRGALVLVAGLVVGAAILIPGGSAATLGTGTFSADFTVTSTPSPPRGGAAATIHLTITNESNGSKLDSADVTAPPGFVITDSSTLHLQHLGLTTQGASYSTDIAVATACTPKTHFWTITAKDKSGADLALDEASSSLTTVVSGTDCQFKFKTQPTDAAFGTPITGSKFTPSPPASPVTVAVWNPAAGDYDSNASGSVRLSASKGSFTGIGPVTLDSDGQAPFPDLTSSTTSAQFISLTASAAPASTPFLSSDPSDLFNILADVEHCTASCNGHHSQDATTVDATVSGFADHDILAVGVNSAADDTFVPPLDCGGTSGSWTPLIGASWAQIEYVPAGTGWSITITMRIEKSLIPTSKGASQFDVCLGAKMVTQDSCADAPSGGFTTKGGPAAPCDSFTGLYWGLLPDCPNGNKKPLNGPCVKSKTKNNAGDLILTAVKPPPWDGSMHG